MKKAIITLEMDGKRTGMHVSKPDDLSDSEILGVLMKHFIFNAVVACDGVIRKAVRDGKAKERSERKKRKRSDG